MTKTCTRRCERKRRGKIGDNFHLHSGNANTRSPLAPKATRLLHQPRSPAARLVSSQYGRQVNPQMRHSTQCALLVLFTPHPEHWMTFSASRADADHAPPSGDGRRERAHVWAEGAGQQLVIQRGTTQERSKQQQHHPGNTRGCSEGVSGTDGSPLDVARVSCPVERNATNCCYFVRVVKAF